MELSSDPSNFTLTPEEFETLRQYAECKFIIRTNYTYDILYCRRTVVILLAWLQLR